MESGSIHVNFMVLRMKESAPKTFMPIQTPDLQSLLSISYIFVVRQYKLALLTFILGGPFEIIKGSYSQGAIKRAAP